MLNKTKKALLDYATVMDSGTQRVQAFNVAGLTLVDGETIAERIKRDHNDSSSHLRVAEMMYEAGYRKV